jgi:DNA (cytosine-5)-methyltransferase 1
VELKPPYRVPSMTEVRTRPRNGLVVASLFAGAGGSSLGYRMAGYRVDWANEFVPAAAQTYRANASPSTVLNEADIRSISGDDVMNSIGLERGKLDVLDGSPPCSSFSMAGSRQDGWGKVKKYSDKSQRTDDLFFEYARLVGELRPRAFVAENVAGLVVGKAKGYFLQIRAALRAHGYEVRSATMDSQWLGVPQARRRVFFVGVREDVAGEFEFPSPLQYRYSIEDALAGLPKEDVSGLSIAKCAIYPEWQKLSPGGASDRYFSLVRPDPRGPCPTITASTSGICTAGVAHHSEPRKYSVAELKRICSFPDDYELTGGYQQQVERLGRSVPPLMMRGLAEKLAEVLL